MDSELHNFDQNLINEAYQNGGFLLVFNVPKGICIGLDWHEFLTDKKFLGFKMIPTDKSYHFLYANAISQENVGAPGARVCYSFQMMRPGEIQGIEWDQENEMFRPYNGKLPNNEQIKSLDSELAPFPYKTGIKWKSLTSNILLKNPDNLTLEYNPHYHDLPKYWFDTKNATSEERWDYHKKDSSWLFKSQTLDLKKLLSDFEYHFIYFVLGQDFNAFENWKKTLRILSHFKTGFEIASDNDNDNDKGTSQIKEISKFIRTLIIQLVEFPADMLEVAQDDNLLYEYCCHIIQLSKRNLPERAQRLEEFIGDQFQWSLPVQKQKNNKLSKTQKYSLNDEPDDKLREQMTAHALLMADFDDLPEDERPVIVDLL